MKPATPLLAALVLAACDDPAAPAAPRIARWPCPDGWVPGPRGGCGPASLLCDPQRGACPSARAWREPGDPEGPPTPTWRPEAGAGAPGELWGPAAGITQCPTGWRLAAGACDPALRTDCPAGSVALPGGACVAVASATCDDDAFPDADPSVTGAVARVRAGADATSADGSAERPFAAINAAIARVGDDGQVLVARGEYREALEVTGRVTVLGRCGVTLVGPAGRPVAAVRGAGASLVLRRVALSGGTSGAVASAGAYMVLGEVRVAGTTGIGVDAEGANTTVRIDGLAVSGTAARRDIAGGYVDGDALVARGGARVIAQRVLAEGNEEAGVWVGDGATVALIDSVVRGTEPRPDGMFGQGFFVAAGGSLTAARVVVEGSFGGGAQAAGARARLELSDSVVRGTRYDRDSRRGEGVVATAGGRVAATGVLVADNWGAGALAADAGSALTLANSVVRDTRANRDSTGYGLLARDGASLTATGTVVERSVGVGAYARAGATLTLGASVVRATEVGTVVTRDGSSMLATRHAVGVAAVGARAEVDHALLDGDATMGVFAIASPGAARAVVRDTVVRSERTGGSRAALVANAGGAIEATRVRMASCGVVSASAYGVDASITLEDCVVARSRRSAGDVVDGALLARAGATLTARRVSVEDSERSAAVAAGEGTRLALEDSLLLHSGRDVGEVTRDRTPTGAVVAFEGAAVDVTRVRIEGSADGAVLAFSAGTRVTLEGAVVQAGEAAYGAMAWGGASLEARRTLFDAGGRFGAAAVDVGTSLTLEDSVVQGTLPSTEGGAGLEVAGGASLTLTRTLVDDNVNIGVHVVGEATRATLTDVAVRGTEPAPGGSGASGALVASGAALTATRTLFDRNRTIGLASIGAAVRLDDVTVSATQPADGVFGAGVLAVGRGTLDARRVALVDLHGVALFAGPSARAPGFEGAPRVTVADAFIRGVRSSAVSLDPMRPREDALAAYGVYCGPGSSLAAERAVIDGGEVGFFVAQGALSLRRALIAGQLGAAGAVTRATPAGAVTTADLAFADNLSNAVRVDDSLPQIDTLPVPSASCPRGGCE